MTEVGNGQNRKKIAVYLSPNLFQFAEQLARQRLTSVSSIIRSLLYEEVVKAATTTEIDAETMIASLKPRHYSNGTPRPSKPPNDLSQANGDTGGFNGEQMSIEQLLEDLETGDVAWTDPQVQQWLSENGYELEPI